MNIPETPDELLRQHRAAQDDGEECTCNICKSVRYISSLEMSVAEAISVQAAIGIGTNKRLLGLATDLIQMDQVPGSIAISHLAGQMQVVIQGLNTCIQTVEEIDKRMSEP